MNRRKEEREEGKKIRRKKEKGIERKRKERKEKQVNAIRSKELLSSVALEIRGSIICTLVFSAVPK